VPLACADLSPASNILGGNFALVGLPSLGASGAIFGTLGVTWVDLVAHWKYHYRPVRRVREHNFCHLGGNSGFVFQLVFMTIELLIGIAMGFIPCEHPVREMFLFYILILM
jgi:hypothetical protein